MEAKFGHDPEWHLKNITEISLDIKGENVIKIDQMNNKVNVIMCEIFYRSVLNKTKKMMKFLKLFGDRAFKNSYKNHYKWKNKVLRY